jgi:hypothetical protein
VFYTVSVLLQGFCVRSLMMSSIMSESVNRFSILVNRFQNRLGAVVVMHLCFFLIV